MIRLVKHREMKTWTMECRVESWILVQEGRAGKASTQSCVLQALSDDFMLQWECATVSLDEGWQVVVVI